MTRSTLNKARVDVSRTKKENEALEGTREEKRLKLEKGEATLAEATADLERARSHMGNLEQAAKQMDELRTQEEARLKQADREAALVKDRMFVESQKLYQARQEEASLTAEISGARRVSRNASHRIGQVRRCCCCGCCGCSCCGGGCCCGVAPHRAGPSRDVRAARCCRCCCCCCGCGGGHATCAPLLLLW